MGVPNTRGWPVVNNMALGAFNLFLEATQHPSFDALATMMSLCACTNLAILALFGAFDAFSARGWADGAPGFAWWVMRDMGLVELSLEGKPSSLLHSLASTIS